MENFRRAVSGNSAAGGICYGGIRSGGISARFLQGEITGKEGPVEGDRISGRGSFTFGNGYLAGSGLSFFQ